MMPLIARGASQRESALIKKQLHCKHVTSEVAWNILAEVAIDAQLEVVILIGNWNKVFKRGNMGRAQVYWAEFLDTTIKRTTQQK
jgi:hypothetical protein